MAARMRRSHGRANGVSPDAIPGIHFASEDEGAALFDERARQALGISGEEFLRRWHAGEYRPIPDTAEGRKVGRLVMLIPFARRAKA